MLRRPAVAVLLAGAVAGCGDADPERPAATVRPEPAVDLRVEVSDGEGRTAAATLACGDGRSAATGFLEGRPADLCAFARREAGFLAAEPPRDRVCTEIFGGPDTARVTGTIGTASVDRRFARANGCEIADWDRAAPLFEGAPRSALRRGG